MMSPKEMVEEAEETGILHVHGEMDLPWDVPLHVAFIKADTVAKACGYTVKIRYGTIVISGGDMSGDVILDWLGQERGPISVSLRTCATAYKTKKGTDNA